MTGPRMDQGPSEPCDAPPPADPATLAEAIEEARAEREEQGRVVLERARALREAYAALVCFPLATDDEHLTSAGEARAVARHGAMLDVTTALHRLLEADEDLERAERHLARLEAEQGAPLLDEMEYVRARAVGLADRDDARGVAGTMRRGAEG